MWLSVVESFWFYLPVICGNLVVYALGQSIRIGIPIDLGMTVGARRLISDSRSIGGMLVWVYLSILVASLQGRALQGLYLGVGAFTGTLVNSLIKRRFDFCSRKGLYVLDETDFILGATVFYGSCFAVPWQSFFIALVVVGSLHKLTNIYIRPLWEQYSQSGAE